ncbi:MAG: nitrilase-related carbon-nitrogen hydrolase [Limisphaerales bacterium]
MKRAATQVVKLGLIQTDCSANTAANLKKTLALVERAAKSGAQIICTQELFCSQYFCQSETTKILNWPKRFPVPAPTPSASSRRSTKSSIIASLFEKRASGVYHNTAAIIDADGSLLGIYRKMHIPDDPLFYEKFYFTPGDLGFKTWQTRYGKIGVLICWDQWYPEAARLTAMQGAEILFYPTAIGWHPSEKKEYGERQHGAWETIQRQSRRGQWLLRRVSQPHRTRSHQRRRRRRPGILGPKFCRRNIWRNSRQSLQRQGRDFDRARGPRQSGHDAYTLAVPARPPD